jgi:hypothetical protein
MDYLSRCYTTAARWRDDSDATITIRWYRAAPNASVYEAPHAFGSQVWDDEDWRLGDGPGEVTDTTEWFPCGTPIYPGTDPVTNPDWLLNGVPVGQCNNEIVVTATLGFNVQVRVALQRVQARLGFLFFANQQPISAMGRLGFDAQVDQAPVAVAGRLGFDAQVDQAPVAVAGRLGFDAQVEIAGPHGSATFTSSGEWIVPPLVTDITVEAYGPGGDGENASGGGGGGGGGWANTDLTVSSGDIITFGLDSASSWISNTGVSPVLPTDGALATAGSAGNSLSGGIGGTGTGALSEFDGGSGGDAFDTGGGGGGGGGASSGGDGSDGGTSTGVTGGAGGTAVAPGGPGGNGGDALASGVNGTFPGGGGGGTGAGGATLGSGAGGCVIITW